MLDAHNSWHGRKVRCPKCTALLREPSKSVYQCPICSTLLSAGGSRAGANSPNGMHDSFHGLPFGKSKFTEETKDANGQLGVGKTVNISSNAAFVSKDVCQDAVSSELDPPAGSDNKEKPSKDGVSCKVSASPAETKLPADKRMSDSSTTSGESSDRSDQGRHFTSIWSASVTGSDPSPAWSSSENVEISEADILVGQTETRSCDVQTSNIGQVCCDSYVVEKRKTTQHEGHQVEYPEKFGSQIRATEEEPTGAELDTSEKSFVDVDHPWSDFDNNHEQHRSLVELSFRIDSSADSGHSYISKGASETPSLARLDSILCAKDTDCLEKSRIGGDAGARGRMRFEGSHSENTNHVDERMMKLRAIDLTKPSFKGQAFPSFSRKKIELNRKVSLGGESQCQVLSPRNIHKSRHAKLDDRKGDGMEKCQRVALLQHTLQDGSLIEQEAIKLNSYVSKDLNLKQGMFASQVHGRGTHFQLYALQKGAEAEEQDLYLNYALPSPRHSHKEGCASNYFSFQDEMAPPRVALKSPTKGSRLNPESNSFLWNQRSEGEATFRDQLGHPLHDIAGPYYHPHAGPQGLKGSQLHSGEQYSVDTYRPTLLPSNRAFPLPRTAQMSTALSPACLTERTDLKPLNSAPAACTCCKHHAYMQPSSHMPHRPIQYLCARKFSEHLPIDHQHGCPQAHAHHHTMVGNYPANHNIHRQPGPNAQYNYLAKKEEGCPPLPGCGAPPYVLCQGCSKILQVPDFLPYEGAIQRLRCGACKRISKFCVARIIYNQAKAYHPCPYVNTHMMFSTAEKNLTHEKTSLYKKIYTGACTCNSTKKLEGPTNLCSVTSSEGRKMDIQRECQRTLPGYDVEKLDGVHRIRPHMPVLQNQQGLCELEWSHENNRRFLDVGSFPCSTVPIYESNGDGHRVPNSEARASQNEVVGHGDEAFEAPAFVDKWFQEPCDSRARVSSREMEVWTTESQQMNSKNHIEEQLSIAPGSPPMDHNVGHNFQQGSGAFTNGASSTPGSPDAGSASYKHVSHEAAYDIREWAFANEGKGDQADIESSTQETSKGPKYLADLLKRSIRDLRKGGQGNIKHEKVVVNGQIIPDAAIKRAEKRAGKIHPGIYWYDYHAGFWGVTGGPCLGIVPPFIQEFKLPLTKDCAGGTTGVFINGRELNQKDLDVLVGRGLPRSPGKAYMVDINGDVVDQTTGKVLKSLGKLAPTIERRGRGCGMYRPNL